ncbi:hypothetical protein BVRB_4g088870 [Beta vulgaris subsp. vulgaris]|nr:hypothetical protein BVRB_4g088870 [Beta vulgaris subsp. vulgaris]
MENLHTLITEGEAIRRLLLKREPKLIEQIPRDGFSVFHSWAKEGKLWPFERLLRSTDVIPDVRRIFVDLICAISVKEGYNPLHVLAGTTGSDLDAVLIAKLFIDAYKQAASAQALSMSADACPWLVQDKQRGTPRSEAIKHGYQNLAIYILVEDNNALLTCPTNVLCLAIEEGCHEVVDLIMEIVDKQQWTQLLTDALHLAPLCKKYFLEWVFKRAFKSHWKQLTSREQLYYIVGLKQRSSKVILNRLDRGDWNKYLIDSSDGRNILHLAPNCTDKDFAIWLVKAASEFITESDKSKIKTPLDEASDVGAAWIIQAMLKNDPSAFTKAPLAWVKACKKGHISTIRAFIDNFPGYFKDHCIKHKDSPLHHIQSLSNLTEYEEFLKIPRMKDLINLRDSQGATPLHQAIRSENIFLTEALLNMDKIMYNIRDDLYPYETARGLLEQKCKGNQEWDQMCKNIGFDPRMKTAYLERRTNLLDVRNTLSVVAALLARVATITFTAGFTLPGGFDQNTGEAILRKKVAFLVFLLSDTLAMCCSMLVLICLIWSMVYDSNKSLFLIDRSMMLLLIALYSTLVAFMAGVYVVISPQCLWPTIVIIVMCSLIGFSANRTLLYKILEKLIPSVNKECGDPCHLVELGKGCLYRNANSCLKCN